MFGCWCCFHWSGRLSQLSGLTHIVFVHWFQYLHRMLKPLQGSGPTLWVVRSGPQSGLGWGWGHVFLQASQNLRKYSGFEEACRNRKRDKMQTAKKTKQTKTGRTAFCVSLEQTSTCPVDWRTCIHPVWSKTPNHFVSEMFSVLGVGLSVVSNHWHSANVFPVR